MTKIEKSERNRIAQGDIYPNIDYIEYVVESDGMIEVSRIRFPYVIVLTQDCDLEQDSELRPGSSEKQPLNQDKLLLSVIVAPLYNEKHLLTGIHLNKITYNGEPITMQNISADSKTKQKLLLDNQLPRYHYLAFPADSDIPNSVIDFKHYFTVNADFLIRARQSQPVWKVAELHREAISHRFASFLSRIGLPDIPGAPGPSANVKT